MGARPVETAMLRTRALAVLALVALLTLPAVGAAPLQHQGSSPVRGSWPFVPQLHCEIVFDAPQPASCKVVGPGTAVNQLRLRLVGAGHVVAFMDDEGNGGRIQVASLSCEASCIVPMPRAVTSDRLVLYVYASGASGTVMMVDAEFGVGGLVA